MERTDAERRMARSYAVTVTPTLFGEWSVLREWGRIGQAGTVRVPPQHENNEFLLRFQERQEK